MVSRGQVGMAKLSETLSRGLYLHSCAGPQSRPRCLHRPVRRDAPSGDHSL